MRVSNRVPQSRDLGKNFLSTLNSDDLHRWIPIRFINFFLVQYPNLKGPTSYFRSFLSFPFQRFKIFKLIEHTRKKKKKKEKRILSFEKSTMEIYFVEGKELLTQAARWTRNITQCRANLY